MLVSWLLRTIHNNYTPADERLEEFLNTVGRTKFLKPLYAKLCESHEGYIKAGRIYENASSKYRITSRAAVEKILTEKEDN